MACYHRLTVYGEKWSRSGFLTVLGRVMNLIFDLSTPVITFSYNVCRFCCDLKLRYF